MPQHSQTTIDSIIHGKHTEIGSAKRFESTRIIPTLENMVVNDTVYNFIMLTHDCSREVRNAWR